MNLTPLLSGMILCSKLSQVCDFLKRGNQLRNKYSHFTDEFFEGNIGLQQCDVQCWNNFQGCNFVKQEGLTSRTQKKSILFLHEPCYIHYRPIRTLNQRRDIYRR